MDLGVVDTAILAAEELVARGTDAPCPAKVYHGRLSDCGETHGRRGRRALARMAASYQRTSHHQTKNSADKQATRDRYHEHMVMRYVWDGTAICTLIWPNPGILACKGADKQGFRMCLIMLCPAVD